MRSSGLGDEVLGLREAQAAFRKLPDVAREAFNAATEVTLSEIVRGAKDRIRANPSVQTRSLLNSVAFSLDKRSGRGKAGVTPGGTNLGPGLNVRGFVIAGRHGSARTSQGAKFKRPTKYAHLVEFGHGGKAAHAEPFMKPAAEAEQGPYLARCRAAGQVIERDMAQIGGRHL